jgi:hypothetical protein
LAKRASYDPEVLHGILDEGFVAHVAFDHEGHPFVIPMAYVRTGNEIILHGAAASRMLKIGASGAPVSVCVTILDGFVYAKSAFHHSVNYRSAIVLGHAREVTDEHEKRAVLDKLVERVSPGRSKVVRGPNEKELASTRVIAVPIEEASAKIRTGGPIDDEEDLTLPVWAGHLPLAVRAEAPVAADGNHPLPALPRGLQVSKSTTTGA